MRFNTMTLGDLIKDPITGEQVSSIDRHRIVVDVAVASEAAGFDGVNLGEHHGLDYVLSAPPVMLAAIAARTTTLRLGTAVTLMANLDALRAAEDYATLDVVSDGRAEMVAGRGNFFAGTYTLFGQSVDESRERFDEGIELLLQLWTGEEINWKGSFRPPIEDFRLQPPPVQQPHPPLWIGGGSSPETAALAARFGLPLMLPSAFGNPEVFRPVVDVYKEQYAAAGHTAPPEIGACWHVNVGTDSEKTKERWEPRYRAYHSFMAELLAKVNPTMPKHIKPFDYDWLCTTGPAVVGSPDEVSERLHSLSEKLDLDLHLIYFDMGGMPRGEQLDMVEMFGEKVIPQFS
jgi:alkanesulfonate monooxygenase SsuD/methylene tetrahydromethanopterin reductase-like flavin-dependent oxidoreductase (luciferase family)